MATNERRGQAPRRGPGMLAGNPSAIGISGRGTEPRNEAIKENLAGNPSAIGISGGGTEPRNDAIKENLAGNPSAIGISGRENYTIQENPPQPTYWIAKSSPDSRSGRSMVMERLSHFSRFSAKPPTHQRPDIQQYPPTTRNCGRMEEIGVHRR